MFEDEWVMPIRDGKKIYGRMVHAKAEPADNAIVFVHGLTCDLTDQPYLPAAYTFARKGYDCILFNLYDWRPDARHLNDCTLKTHAADFDTILTKKAKVYKNIFAIGHSYGGPSILQAQCKGVKAVSLWDPSYNIADWWPEWTFRKNNMKFFHGPTDVLMPEPLNAEAMTFDRDACRRLGCAFKTPMQVIHAGQGILYKYSESYHDACKAETDYALILTADHCFTTQRALNSVVRKTHAWFQKHSA